MTSIRKYGICDNSAFVLGSLIDSATKSYVTRNGYSLGESYELHQRLHECMNDKDIRETLSDGVWLYHCCFMFDIRGSKVKFDVSIYNFKEQSYKDKLKENPLVIDLKDGFTVEKSALDGYVIKLKLMAISGYFDANDICKAIVREIRYLVDYDANGSPLINKYFNMTNMVHIVEESLVLCDNLISGKISADSVYLDLIHYNVYEVDKYIRNTEYWHILTTLIEHLGFMRNLQTFNKMEIFDKEISMIYRNITCSVLIDIIEDTIQRATQALGKMLSQYYDEYIVGRVSILDGYLLNQVLFGKIPFTHHLERSKPIYFDNKHLATKEDEETDI